MQGTTTLKRLEDLILFVLVQDILDFGFGLQAVLVYNLVSILFVYVRSTSTHIVFSDLVK